MFPFVSVTRYKGEHPLCPWLQGSTSREVYRNEWSFDHRSAAQIQPGWRIGHWFHGPGSLAVCRCGAPPGGLPRGQDPGGGPSGVSPGAGHADQHPEHLHHGLAPDPLTPASTVQWSAPRIGAEVLHNQDMDMGGEAR